MTSFSALERLSDLRTVITTTSLLVPRFIASSVVTFRQVNDDVPSSSSSTSSSTTSWTVTIALEGVWSWWTTTVCEDSLVTLLASVDTIVECWNTGQLGFSAPSSISPPQSWSQITFHIGSSIQLILQRLSSQHALETATRLSLLTLPLVSELNHKIESLKHDRIKYRQLLSRSNSSSVPLVASSQSRSRFDRTSSHQSTSSSNSSSVNVNVNMNSSSQNIALPSTSQQKLSLVHPNRVFRVDPSQNDEFMGDSDQE